jgi:AAA+ superfamily predicted ATPase
MNDLKNDTDFYSNSSEHILDELLLMDYIIRSHVSRSRTAANMDDEFMGLYIPENAITEYLEKPLFSFGLKGSSDPETENKPDIITVMRKEIDRRVAASREHGTVLRLEKLADSYGLHDLEKNVLILCLIQETDLRYGKLFAYLNNDITRKRVSVNLALDLFCSSFEDRQESLKILTRDSPLVRHRLIRILDEQEGIRLTLLERILEIDEQIMDFLTWDRIRINESIGSFTGIYDGTHVLDELILPENIISKIHAAIRLCENDMQLLFFLQGPRGAGKKASASVISSQVGRDMLVADTGRMVGPEFGIYAELVCREALLRDTTLYFENFDMLLADDAAQQLGILTGMLEDFAGIVFLGSGSFWEPAGTLHTKKFIHLDLPSPAFPERKKLFEKYLRSGKGLVEPESVEGDESAVIDELANRFKFGAGQIIDAVHSAAGIAILEGTGNETTAVTKEQLYLGCKAQSNKKLLQYASMVESNYKWNDIILPHDTVEQLKEIVSYVKNYQIVYSKWGFGDKLSMGKGANILFAGPPGTGKTMAAGIIGGTLGLDLYRIDLSSMVSKYIGETEKNLNKVFDEARTSNSIVFFDEADALFGKRTEIKDAHDRYANIEVSYLLQKMEEHEGIIILASNMKSNIDEAFLRRMHFSIDFPFPDERCRERIWKVMVPDKAPVEEAIDYVFLARRFKLPGGNIKNIQIAAAFLAAEEGGTIGMRHIVRATKRELQKMGRSITAADFGDYYKFIEGD